MAFLVLCSSERLENVIRQRDDLSTANNNFKRRLQEAEVELRFVRIEITARAEKIKALKLQKRSLRLEKKTIQRCFRISPFPSQRRSAGGVDVLFSLTIKYIDISFKEWYTVPKFYARETSELFPFTVSEKKK